MAYQFTTGAGKNLSLPATHKTYGPKSVGVWLFVSELPDAADFTLFEKSDAGDANKVWEAAWIATDGSLNIRFYRESDTTPVELSVAQADWYKGQQYHTFVFTCAYDGGTGETIHKVYVNGLLVTSSDLTAAKEAIPGSHLYVGNNRALTKPCDGLWLLDLVYYGVVLSPFEVYRQWVGHAIASGWGFAVPVSYWPLVDDALDDGSSSTDLTLVNVYEQKEVKCPNLEFREALMNPLVDAYTWLWYLLETGGFLDQAQVAWRNRIRYDLGLLDPTKDQIAPADLPEIRIVYEGGDTNVRHAKDLARLAPAYSVQVTTGDNRFDKGLGDLVWRILKSLAKYPDFDLAGESMEYIHTVQLGSEVVGDMAGAKQARGSEDWYEAFLVTITMSLSKTQMGVT